MSWSDARESPGLGFDDGTEFVATEGALLLQAGANGLQVFFGQGLVKQRSARSNACGHGYAKSKVGAMMLDQCIILATVSGAA